MTAVTPGTVTIRPEAASDIAPVRHLLEQAFAGPGEAQLVERLRAGGDLALALVADHEDGIAGYAAFVRLTVESESGAAPAIGLAPLAVAPTLQRQGIGGMLVRAGLSRLRGAGETLVFVLGDAAYYRRFGFDLAGAEFRSAYSGPHFMLTRLNSGAPSRGTVHYPTAFAEL